GGNNNMSVLINTTPFGGATASFTATAVSTGAATTSVTVGRINPDTIPDIALTTAANNGQVIVFQNPGGTNPAFVNPLRLAAGTNPRGVQLADVDSSGGTDLLVANANAAGTASVVLNNSLTGTITTVTGTATTITYNTNSPNGLAVG